MKLLHTADLHLDSPLKSLALRDPELRAKVQTASRAALTRIVDTALTEEVAALLIAGDLFDGAERSARTGAFLVHQFERLRARGIRVFYIKGNHDAENPLTGAMRLPDNVHVFSGRGEAVELAAGVYIHGVSFSARHAATSLLPKFQAPIPGATNIALLHTSLGDSEGHSEYAPCTLQDLLGAGFDYWALGHIHRRRVHAQAPWVVMPGIPQGRDIGEAGPKSATLITLGDTIRIDEVPTAEIEFCTLAVDASGLATEDALRALMRRRMRDLLSALRADSAVIRVTLTGQTPLRWQLLRDQDLWAETARDLARETGQLWLDKLVLDLPPAPADTSGRSAVDELAEIMAEIRAEPGFVADSQADLEALLKELPPQRRAALMPDEAARDALAQNLAATGADRILARLKGASD